ncbi:MAG: site-specific DNA-methyltransferase [Rhodocyclaceae bacterium]|nr:site-specific DNA-methyltransferase [Rhodocyclaceae bacterium]
MSKQEIPVARARGRPMLTWVGKKPLARVTAFPAQHIETVPAPQAAANATLGAADWKEWPRDLAPGGLLYHGDNKEVLAHLLANGFRGQVKLIYIDPPFDSGADYVRKVQLRGPKTGAKVEGEDYTLGEQVQYSDIWANDNYLQFMYERLLLLRELLSEEGSLVVHCDWGKSHLLRCVADEVFGNDHFRNEIVWRYAKYQMRGTSRFVSNHDTLFWYSAGTDPTYNLVTEALDEPKLLKRKKWDSGAAKIVNVRDQDGKLIYDEYHESKVDDVWEIDTIGATSGERTGYPTQKPLPLLERIISSLSNPGDVVLDGFIGSGTTAVAAQKLGRRWIGCDINKGAIQTTAKRLQGVIAEQAEKLAAGRQGELVAAAAAPPLPCQLAFTTWRVNDYDLQIQHNEAVELACEHLGITRRRTDSFFDGVRGQMLVKIVPFNHPLSPLDLESIRTELKSRPEEERDILVVSLGQEHAARDWVAHYNQNRPINKIHLIELRSDRKSGGFIRHEPMSAQVAIRREGERLVVDIADVVSPSILQRLNKEGGVFRAEIPDWRAVVDCVLIDTDHDGKVFNVALADVPERKQDLVAGRYELPAPRAGAMVAVKIVDMLGEEHVTTDSV